MKRFTFLRKKTKICFLERIPHVTTHYVYKISYLFYLSSILRKFIQRKFCEKITIRITIPNKNKIETNGFQRNSPDGFGLDGRMGMDHPDENSLQETKSATSMNNIEEGLKRIQQSLRE